MGNGKVKVVAAAKFGGLNLLRHNITTTPPKGGRADNKTTLNNCFRAS